jgi:hypothetical protein
LLPTITAFSIVKVFLSWSGERSKAVAEALKSWLPQVIQSLEPWISSEIDKGRKWSTELATELETVPVGIICLTSDNLSKPWILFEAGALSKNANTWTFLFDVTAANVEQPLAQFQHTENEKEDIRKLVRSIAGAARNAGERVPEAGVLNDIFETFWPKLEEKFNAVAPVRADAVPAGSVRSDREILEEILEVLRGGLRREVVSGVVRVPATGASANTDFAVVTIRADSEKKGADFDAAVASRDVVGSTRLLNEGITMKLAVSFLQRFDHWLIVRMFESVAADVGGVEILKVTFP